MPKLLSHCYPSASTIILYNNYVFRREDSSFGMMVSETTMLSTYTNSHEQYQQPTVKARMHATTLEMKHLEKPFSLPLNYTNMD